MKRMLAALALFGTLMLPGLVQAQGMYIAPKFLMSIQDTGRVERSRSLAGSDVSDFSQFTVGGAVAAGFDFYPQFGAPLRAELEFALRGNTEKSWSGAAFEDVKGKWNNTTLFANVFWDFHNSSAFTPYVGAGLGLAFNYTGYDIKKTNGDRFSADERHTNFAWNAGAGVAYNFNENFAIDASYRFVGLGYNEVSTTVNNTKYEIGNQPYINEFAVGARFTF